MQTQAWSTQQLAEFAAAISVAGSENDAAIAAVELAAEALDADIAAIVSADEVVAAVGYANGNAPAAELAELSQGSLLDVPGVGACLSAAVVLEYPPAATLLVARREELTREEHAVLRGMGLVTSMTMRTRRVVAEQAALRRVATLVASGATPEQVFAAVAEEVGHVLPEADVAFVARYIGEDAVEFTVVWSRRGDASFAGRRVQLGGRNVATLVFESGAPARVDSFEEDGNSATVLAREWARSAAGAPIIVDGRLWGVMTVGSSREHGLPTGTEQRLAQFVELVATAIGNTDARVELRALADEQAALRRVATLVARGEAPAAVFELVAEEAGRLLSADLVLIGRRVDDATVVGVTGWRRTGEPVPGGTRITLGGRNATTLAAQTGRPARVDSYEEAATGDVAADALARGIRSAVGAPVHVGGTLWGVLVVASLHLDALPAYTEDRLANFAELVATAIANAQAREELRRVAEEQAALRRVATLVAGGAPQSDVVRAVIEEVGQLRGSEIACLTRYLPPRQAVAVAAWDATGAELPLSGPFPLVGRNVTTLVYETGRAAQVEYRDGAGPLEADGVARGVLSAAGAPVVVAGRLWGVMSVASTREEPLPPDTAERLAEFTELVATAIANAESQAELTASRARIVATADETRRRIERDLHDGAQQRLVSLALQLRAAQAAVPPDLRELATEIDNVVAGLTSALDELREFARGIHPAILADGGLERALKTLARRSTVPVELAVSTNGRLPQAIEVGAYYVVSEALANAAKHAGASVIAVEVEATDAVLHVRVRDDGVGGAGFERGTGLLGLKDRAEALGGRLDLRSEPGLGTSLSVELPLRPGSG